MFALTFAPWVRPVRAITYDVRTYGDARVTWPLFTFVNSLLTDVNGPPVYGC